MFCSLYTFHFCDWFFFLVLFNLKNSLSKAKWRLNDFVCKCCNKHKVQAYLLLFCYQNYIESAGYSSYNISNYRFCVLVVQSLVTMTKLCLMSNKIESLRGTHSRKNLVLHEFIFKKVSIIFYMLRQPKHLFRYQHSTIMSPLYH